MENYKKTIIFFRKLKSLFKLLTVPDLILVLFLFFLLLLSTINILWFSSEKIVEIYYENELFGVYSLNNEEVIKIDYGIVAQIKNGKVKMLESTCNNQICVNQGDSDLLPIICAPRKVAIIIKNISKEQILITR